MKLKRPLEKVFLLVSPILRPERVQRLLSGVGLRLPYFLAKHLDYRGLVAFRLRGTTLRMRSYNTPIEMTIFWKGLFNGREGAELRFWDRAVQNADVILDIGANNGIYSLVASTNAKAKIYAFEPVPLVCGMLRENISLSGCRNVEVREMVVGESEGTATLYIPYSGYVDIASILPEFVADRKEDSASEVMCPMTSVDAFLEQERIGSKARILCKIDVEGAEMRVIKGMTESLKNGRINFMIEILNETSFASLKEALPKNYGLYPITDHGSIGDEMLKFSPVVKNYYCQPRGLSLSVTKK